MNKLKLNFEGKQVFPRHFWSFQKKVCSCGCSKRIYLKGDWCCIDMLRQELNKVGFSLQENFDNKQS